MTDTKTEILAIIEQSQKRADAATEGPWDFHGQSITFAISHVKNGVHSPRVVNGDAEYVKGCKGGVVRPQDAVFIAAARTDVPNLAEALRIAVEYLYADVVDIEIHDEEIKNPSDTLRRILAALKGES